ncbi:MAG TPA: N-acyl homoserine lactonase family protein [Pseudonocardiaceae bacterium]|nr:N-acyl homoserine lactonase family protein [Pseudonocardiaceae bacterium]
MTRVHAIRYAWRAGVRADHFVDDERPDDPHPTAYYVWLVVSGDHAVLVDTGMGAGADRVPGLHRGPSVATGLRALGVSPESVDTVVLTHLHYDHAGGVRDFPNARYLLQRSELDGLTDTWLVDPSDVDYLLGSNRLTLVDGDADVLPGVTVHHVGGHTPGTQVVRVLTAQGHLVVASDAAHFHENISRRRPGPLTHSVPDAIRAFERVTELADGRHLILPGHDPSPGLLPAVHEPDGLDRHVTVVGQAVGSRRVERDRVARTDAVGLEAE